PDEHPARPAAPRCLTGRIRPGSPARGPVPGSATAAVTGTPSHRSGRSPPEPGPDRGRRAAGDTRDARYRPPARHRRRPHPCHNVSAVPQGDRGQRPQRPRRRRGAGPGAPSCSHRPLAFPLLLSLPLPLPFPFPFPGPLSLPGPFPFAFPRPLPLPGPLPLAAWTVLTTGATGADGLLAGPDAGAWTGLAVGRREDGAVLLSRGAGAADEEGTTADEAVTGCQGDANPITLATTMTMTAASAAQ